VAVDDKCHDCWTEFNAGGFGRYMDFLAFGKLKQNRKEAKEISEAKASQGKGPDERLFDTEDVFDEATVRTEVARSFLILSDHEYAAACGSKPLARHPKTVRLRVPRLDGQGDEEVHCFQDSAQPYRTLTLTASSSTARQIHILRPEKHMHEAQAQKMHQQAVRDRHKTKEALLFGNLQVAELDDFVDKVKATDGCAASAKKKCKGHGDADESGGAATDDDTAEDAQARLPLSEPKVPAVVVQSDDEPENDMCAARSSAPPAPSPRSTSPRACLRRSMSFVDMPSGSPPQDSGDILPGDSVSQIGAVSEVADSEEEDGVDKFTASRWIKKMPLEKIMLGHKLGVWIRLPRIR